MALAHLVMQDGSFGTSGGVYIFTDAFKPEDVLRLTEHVALKYNLVCSTHKAPSQTKSLAGGGPRLRLYIHVKSLKTAPREPSGFSGKFT